MSRRALSPEAVDAAWLALMAALVWLISGALVTGAALDTDAVNLALAIERFDVVAHQPHPPGYLGYVLVLRGLDAVTGLAPLEVVVLASRLMVIAAIPLTYAAGRALADRRAALVAAALVASSPLSLYYAIDGQTHAAELAVAAALMWRLAIARRDSGSVAGAIAVGALLAAGGSLRPSFALVAAGPVLWIYGKRWRPLSVVVAVGAAGTAAWAIPTVVMTGGWARYRAASDALIGMFARATSAMSSQADARMVADNWVAAGLWLGLIAAPVAAAGLHRLARRRAGEGARAALIYAAVSAAPAALFYALVFIAEPGYVIGLVAPAAVAAAALCDRGRLADRLVLWLAVAAQLAVFMLAPATGSAAWIPAIAEITERQAAVEIVVDRVSDGVEPGEPLLVIADRGPTALYRQLPLQRPETDVLFVHSAALAVHDATTLSLSRAGDWVALPGPVLLADGPPSVLRVRRRYRRIAIGPIYSDELRAALAAQSRCPIPPPDARLTTPKLDPDCFAAAIEIAGHRFEWGRNSDEVAPR